MQNRNSKNPRTGKYSGSTSGRAGRNTQADSPRNSRSKGHSSGQTRYSERFSEGSSHSNHSKSRRYGQEEKRHSRDDHSARRSGRSFGKKDRFEGRNDRFQNRKDRSYIKEDFRKKPGRPKQKPNKVLLEKAGNMLYPLPAVLITCINPETGEPNVMTAAWVGTVCSDPAMVSVSIRPERYSHDLIKECGNFTINLTTEDLAWATDYCGVKSGRDVNKFKKAHLTPEDSEFIDAPTILESPVSLECEVRDMIELGSHDMFIAEVLAVHADKNYLDKTGAFHLENAFPLCYIHGKYYGTGRELGYFGYSITKKRK